MKKRSIIILIFFLLVVSSFFYLRYQIYYSHGNPETKVTLSISKGEGVKEVAQKLEDEKLISQKAYLYYYLKINNLSKNIFPGDYIISGNMTIPEIATLLTTVKEEAVKITFPEGWTSREMAKRLTENGLDGNGFLEAIKNSDPYREKYEFLRDPKIKDLEGYLFPDTYFFKKDISGENIVKAMLNNFSNKVYDKIGEDMQNKNYDLREIVILSSLIELEVTSKEDRSMVSGVFWNRLNSGMPLQSCTTIGYVLGEKKKQYSYDDTRVVSPYNTYINKGLPPGPIANSGFDSILAAIHPQNTDYMYFLSDPTTGKTFYSKTLEEQAENKEAHGL